MMMLVKFEKNGVTLLDLAFPVDEKGDVERYVHLAHEEFRKAHPNVLLMDGVTVIFDKA